MGDWIEFIIKPLQELKVGIWKQGLKHTPGEHYFTGFLALAWSDSFLKHPGPTCLGMIPKVAWTLAHQLANKKMHHITDKAIGQSDGDSSEVCSTQVDSRCLSSWQLKLMMMTGIENKQTLMKNHFCLLSSFGVLKLSNMGLAKTIAINLKCGWIYKFNQIGYLKLPQTTW